MRSRRNTEDRAPRVVCAWCGATISGPLEGPADSHGICPTCNESQMKEARLAAAEAAERRRRAKRDQEKQSNGARRAPRFGALHYLDAPLGRNRPDRGWWKAIHPYVSPRERILDPHETWVRAIAYGIKHGDDGAIATAAAEMAHLVPYKSWVIPAPASRAWQYGGVRKLAELLARITGGTYAEPIARTRTVESSHQRRKSGGRGLSVDEHVASMESRMQGPCPEKIPVVVIDNVVTTGATLEAVKRLLGPGCDVRAVVWAEATEAGA